MRNLMVSAVRKCGSIADNERNAPRICAKRIGHPAIRKVRKCVTFTQIVVFLRHHHDRESSRWFVALSPGNTKAKRILSSLFSGVIESFTQIFQQLGLRHREFGRALLSTNRAIQIKMRQAADVRGVENPALLTQVPDRLSSPICSRLQIKNSVAVRQPSRQIAFADGEVKFRRRKLQVIPPLRLGVKFKRRGSDQLSCWHGIRQVKNMFRGQQTAIRISRIARVKNPVTQRKISRDSTRKIWTDLRSRRASHKYRAIANITVLLVSSMRGIIVLRHAPDAVIVFRAGNWAADSHLIVKRFGIVYSHA